MNIGTRALVLGLVLGLGACAPAPKPPPDQAKDQLVLTPATYGDLPGWAADATVQALPALRQSCASVRKRPDGAVVKPRQIGALAAQWKPACIALDAVVDDDEPGFRVYLRQWFSPYHASNAGDPTGLFTGYYEPQLRGRRRPGGEFITPLYQRPADLVTINLGTFRDKLKGQRLAGTLKGGRLVPYGDRAAIDRGYLQNRGLELVWVDDAVDAFFLHIQGSGRVVLEDGSVMRVGYAGANGHVYKAIGRTLIAQGALTRENVSLQSIAAWLRAHPDKAAAVMQDNRSFVFFRELTGAGPLGAQGVALTPGRSLAVDRRHIPLGAPVWLDTNEPLAPDQPLRRLMIAQDTGGAIRGPVRGDVFWGAGDVAAQKAGHMKQTGGYWLLLPKSIRVGD